MLNIGLWDGILIATVSLEGTLCAYLYQPKWKAFLLSLPIPFTLASLALGKPIGTFTMAGLTLLLLFTHSVRLLHYILKLPIIPSIIISATVYCLAGTALTHLLPNTPAGFWTTTAITGVLGLLLLIKTPHRIEKGHRTPLPIWIKFPIIFTVIVFLVISKQFLQGFMTTFPMIGVITAYEGRHSLWTICRQIPVVMLTIGAMTITCYMTQNTIGLQNAILLGLGVFVLTLIPTMRFANSVNSQ